MKFIRIIKASDNIIIDEELTEENEDKIYECLKRVYNLFDVDVDVDHIFNYIIDKMGSEFHSFEDKGDDFILNIYDSNESLNADSLYKRIYNEDHSNYHRPLSN